MGQVNVHLNTGLPGLDRALRGLIPGDNIVFQVDSVDDYQPFVQPYCQSVCDRGGRLVYFRFAEHEPLVADHPHVDIHRLDPHAGFESFIAQIHRAIGQSERGGWYLFDCLSDLAVAWRSDVMLSNFFVLTCPYLYDVEAIAYFALDRRVHAPVVPTVIKDTAQVILDVYRHKQQLYVHPIKVQQRHSPTMYMLHVWEEEDFTPVAESSTTAEILSTVPCLPWDPDRLKQGVWHGTFRRAEAALQASHQHEASDRQTRDALRQVLLTAITRDERMLGLLQQHLTIEDVLAIGRRIVGTGLIGGKAIGMLLARAILQRTHPKWADILEAHDSFYIGSDVFYSFLVRNGLWWETQRYRDSESFLEDPEHFLHDAERARQRIVVGTFPDRIYAELQAMLDYFGQCPIIVRSSSLLEDNFGHSFAGKYESIFLPNQGSRDQRLHDFVSAVRTIYASTMSEEALRYRARRGMLAGDEQMALLVQRVSGAVRGKLFLPDLAGVGFSYNPYVWSKEIDPQAGVLRLVFGLGTRAVDRPDDDFPRVVALNAPERRPVASYDEVLQYSQRRVDVLDLQANQLVTRDFEEVVRDNPGLPIHIVASRNETLGYVPDGGDGRESFPWVLTFDKLLKKTDYVATMRELLRHLQDAYGCPVDMEFTTNFLQDGSYKINLVQCRPLQVKREGTTAEPPAHVAESDRILEAHGAIVGQSRICNIDRMIYVVPSVYGRLPLRDRYSVARLVGKLVRLRESHRPKKIMLLGPGRWGTSSPSLGVPVNFSEIADVAVLSEIVAMHEHLVPDVSLGTHFFNELVEADILYFALFPGKDGNMLNSTFFDQAPNRLDELVPSDAKWRDAVRVVDAPDSDGGTSLSLYASAPDQTVICYRAPETG